jgi:hypothetical protein
MQISMAFGRTEADEEIQDLQGSQGLNLACILSDIILIL